MFATFGYRNGSLRDVAAAADITHAGVRHYFPTKAELLQAVLNWRDEQAIRRMASTDEPFGVLRGWIEAAEHNQNAPHMVELQVSLASEATSPDHPMYTYLLERYDFAVAFLTSAFADLDRRGMLSPGVSPDTAARTLVAVTDGVQTQWLLRRERVDMGGIVRGHIERLLSPDARPALLDSGSPD